MSDPDHGMTNGPEAQVLARFLESHPRGNEEAFEAWADKQPELTSDPELRGGASKLLQDWLRAETLLALGKEFDDGGSIFRRRSGGPTESAAPAPGGEALHQGKRIGSFTLTRFIAKGGMGQVWEAEDTELRRRVALKLVLPDRIDARSLELFAREARAGGRLNHPNLVTTLAYGTDDGLSWIAQELVEGSWTVKDSLDALRAEDAVPKDYYREVAELVAKIADGMQAVHDAGVIHRDLKPQNILIADDDTPKVTDFGLARVTDDSVMSQTGDFAGTWAYMSPEQVTAKRMGLDHRTDIFSLGVVMYELLTLRKPFEGDTTHQIAQEIIYADPPAATKVRSQCPRELSVIVGKAMEKVPGNRYGSMGELAADLRRHMANEPILAKPPGALARGGKWVRRHPVVSVAGAIASVALVVVSLLSLNLAARTKELTETSEDLREQTQIAQGNERLAEERAEELASTNVRLAETAEDLRQQTKLALVNEAAAEESAALATQRANDVLSLSATKDLEDLIAEAETLWPAHPEMVPRYERWLADAQVLLDGRPADEDAGVKARPSVADHEAKLAELEARAVPETDEARLAAARDQASYPELERTRADLAWRRRMLGQEAWPDQAGVEATLAQEELPSKPVELLALAWPLVGPDAADLGQVARGRALADRALAAAAGEKPEVAAPRATMVMAWAEARLGEGDAARESARAALELQAAADARRLEDAADSAAAPGEGASTPDGDEGTPAEEEGPAEDSDALTALKQDAQALETFLARWEGPAVTEREAELSGLEARILRLEVGVGERVFEDPEDGWWQRQLAALVRGIRELHEPVSGLAGDTLAEPFGWGVAKRAAFARGIAERSVVGADAARRWAEAIAAIGTSERYSGLNITPQMGLLPIGADLESGLWEFAHLATGDPALRGADGKLVLTEETGLVLVLIPGGTFLMGAQKEEPEGDNYDPQAQPWEGPVHPVTLSPYFLSKYEMTQGQWKRSTAANPSYYKNSDLAPTLLHPVEQVSWTECMALMARLDLELPSEAQWEKGCRGGSSTPWWFGEERESLRGKINIADKTAADAGATWTEIRDWPDHEDGGVVHTEVGSYPANSLGLHEVHGNVYEWCRDGYDSGAYDAAGRTDPEVSPDGSANRVHRGGGFDDPARCARSAIRLNSAPEGRGRYLGLRPARGITTDDFTTSPDRSR